MTLIFKDKENNEEWNRCLDSNSLIWGRCIYACGSNAKCTDDCVTKFQEQLMNCPCEVTIDAEKPNFKIEFPSHIFKHNCPGGCPCEDFNCIETTNGPDVTTSISTTPATTTSPTANAVLVLSTGNASNKPMIVNFNGKSVYH